MQTNFTPGPWRVGDAGCTVFGPPNGNPAPKRIADMAKTPEYKANARIIAAAPSLVEALEACITDENAHCLQHQEAPGAMARRLRAINEIAKAALSCARGE